MLWMGIGRPAMQITFIFVHRFFYGIYLLLPVLVVLTALVIALGQVVGRIEKWGWFNALYWSLITALTVGYGDIRPSTHRTKMLSAVIALIGIMFTGVIVAITVAAATKALTSVIDVGAVVSTQVSK